MMIFRFPLTPYSATFFDVGEPRERGKCMNPRPVAVTPLENYELLITFQNGEKKIFDAKPILSLPLYAPLKNKGFFDTAKADGMCVYWNEDVDLCPDMVYTDSRPA